MPSRLFVGIIACLSQIESDPRVAFYLAMVLNYRPIRRMVNIARHVASRDNSAKAHGLRPGTGFAEPPPVTGGTVLLTACVTCPVHGGAAPVL